MSYQSYPSAARPDDLQVVTCVSNPVRYNSRFTLYERFSKEMKDADANLTTIEAAFGERPHEAQVISNHNLGVDPMKGYGRHLQLQTDDELWHKENLLNLAIHQLPSDWKYVAWVDADITFLRPDWQEETIEALQHYPVVQMFETAIDEGPTGNVMSTHTGFAASFIKGLPYGPGAGGSYGPYWHSGFAWAARREAFEQMGGLLDFAILGAGDHHMAMSFLGRADLSFPGSVNPDYLKWVLAFQERAKDADILNNIGFVPGSIAHHFHGSKKNRKYNTRWEILTKWNFDPALDISRDRQGLWQLTKRGLRMRNDLRAYFRQRNEDDINE